MASSAHSRKKVAYYYDTDIGNYHYGPGHPMKPHRLRMTHNLIVNYGLFRKMEIYRPHKASDDEMKRFHKAAYINSLKTLGPIRAEDELEDNPLPFNLGGDCPIFKGVYEFSQLSAGGSIAGAKRLNMQASDIVINWAGGLHHAKKSKAGGFCYVNDIVLAILELLKYNERVLYVDIDIHHGDGVEEAFYETDRVMTVSFHKYGKLFFPESGHYQDIGKGEGKYYSVNFPLLDGIDDRAYESIFIPIMTKVMESYRPSAIVLQCGADSIADDRLGTFNLTLKGHAKCVEFLRKYNLPLMLLGGGGYSVRNVARCWTFETAVAIGTELKNNLPYNDFFEYYKPDFQLHISPENVKNNNSRQYLDNIKIKLMEHLRMLPCAPGVQMQDFSDDDGWTTVDDSEEEENQNPNERISPLARDKKIVKENEFSDSEDEGEGRRDERFYRTKRTHEEDGGSRVAAKKSKDGDLKEMKGSKATGSDLGKAKQTGRKRRTKRVSKGSVQQSAVWQEINNCMVDLHF